MRSHSDDKTEVIRFGLDVVQADLGIGDAIPDERGIQVEAFGQFE